MRLPKVTRQQIYAAAGKLVEISVPKDEHVRPGQSYAVQTKKGAARVATIFVDTTELRGETRYAMVRLTDRTRHLARQQGLMHPEQYTESEIGALPHDPGEPVDEDTQRALTIAGRERFAKHRSELKAEDERKAQARRARSELTESLEGLDETARLAFLAEIQRMCRSAQKSTSSRAA